MKSIFGSVMFFGLVLGMTQSQPAMARGEDAYAYTGGDQTVGGFWNSSGNWIFVGSVEGVSNNLRIEIKAGDAELLFGEATFVEKGEALTLPVRAYSLNTGRNDYYVVEIHDHQEMKGSPRNEFVLKKASHR